MAKRRRSRAQNTSLTPAAIAASSRSYGNLHPRRTDGQPADQPGCNGSASSSQTVSGRRLARLRRSGPSDYRKLAQLNFKSGGKSYVYVNGNH